jgi:hypothetical protein
VDFPINSMVIFHSYVNVYQRVSFAMIEEEKYEKLWRFDSFFCRD